MWARVLMISILFLVAPSTAHALYGLEEVPDSVMKWAPTIQDECDGMGLEPCPVEQTLAIIFVETLGRTSARHPRSSYHGIMQMGGRASRDTRVKLSSIKRSPRMAIRAHLQYRKRYAKRISFSRRSGVAVLWKCGPGATKIVRKDVISGLSIHDALRKVGKQYRLGRPTRFLNRYEQALVMVEEAYRDVRTIARQPSTTVDHEQASYTRRAPVRVRALPENQVRSAQRGAKDIGHQGLVLWGHFMPDRCADRSAIHVQPVGHKRPEAGHRSVVPHHGRHRGLGLLLEQALRRSDV